MSRPYDHKAIEKKLYSHWMEKGYFGAKPDPDKKPFTIVIPPPNITGQLHLGQCIGRDDAGCADSHEADAGICCAVGAGDRPCQHCDRGKDCR